MAWAFWRSAAPRAAASGRATNRPDADTVDGARDDPAAALRVRTRRRLIGAAALLLAAVIVLPMVLDPTPKPVPDTVAIDIPSEKTPFTPRLPLPAVQEAKSAAAAPAAEPPAAGEEQPPSEVSAKPAPAPAGAHADSKLALQAAALGTEAAARELAAKLKKAGFAPYTERVDTANGPRFRVRVGPYGSREEADQARAKLKALGIDAGLVGA